MIINTNRSTTITNKEPITTTQTGEKEDHADHLSDYKKTVKEDYI